MRINIIVLIMGLLVCYTSPVLVRNLLKIKATDKNRRHTIHIHNVHVTYVFVYYINV